MGKRAFRMVQVTSASACNLNSPRCIEFFSVIINVCFALPKSIPTRKLERYCEIGVEEDRRKEMFGEVRYETRQLLDEFFLGAFLDDELMPGGGPNRERWLKALLGDETLRDAAIEACRSRVASFSKEAEGFSRFLEARGNESATADLREGLRMLKASFSGA